MLSNKAPLFPGGLVPPTFLSRLNISRKESRQCAEKIDWLLVVGEQ
jgi:hypothetical protein